MAVSSTTRLDGVMAAIRARDVQAAPGLAARFAGEAEPGIRAWIVRALVALKAPSGPELFKTALRDPSAMVRLTAAEALAKTQGASSVADLSAALAGEANAGVRRAIVAALGEIKTPESAAVLQQALSTDRDDNVRSQAEYSLRRHGMGRAKKAAKNVVSDKDARVRGTAHEP